MFPLNLHFPEITVLASKKSGACPNSGPAPIEVKLVAPLRMGRYGVKLSARLTPGNDALHR